MFNMKPTQVSPPYLHIMLGIVKNHHTLLQQDCHSLDKEIGMALAKEILSDFEDSSSFGHYVNQLTSIESDKQLKQKYESQLVFVEEFTTEANVLEKKVELEEKLDDLYDSIDEKTKRLQELPQLSGPIAASLDNTQKKNITVQAYHGGSFVGNHCNKYIQQATTENICQSVIRKTYQATDNHDLHNKAHDIAEFSLCKSAQAHISHTAHHRLGN